MTEVEAQALQMGDAVYWGPDPNNLGYVAHVDDRGIVIKWPWGETDWRVFGVGDMTDIEKVND